MDLDILLQRWIPTILVSLLFFALVRALLGSALRALVRPWVIGTVAVLVLVGVIPPSTIGTAIVDSLVFLFGAVHDAYVAVMASTPVG